MHIGHLSSAFNARTRLLQAVSAAASPTSQQQGGGDDSEGDSELITKRREYFQQLVAEGRMDSKAIATLQVAILCSSVEDFPSDHSEIRDSLHSTVRY